MSTDIPYTRFTTREYSLYDLNKKINNGILITCGSASRYGEQYIRGLIETILCGVPLPPVYCKSHGNGVNTVFQDCDKVAALSAFMNNEVALAALDSALIPSVTGMTYRNLPYNYRRMIDNYLLTVHTIEPGTDQRVTDLLDLNAASSGHGTIFINHPKIVPICKNMWNCHVGKNVEVRYSRRDGMYEWWLIVRFPDRHYIIKEGIGDNAEKTLDDAVRKAWDAFRVWSTGESAMQS